MEDGTVRIIDSTAFIRSRMSYARTADGVRRSHAPPLSRSNPDWRSETLLQLHWRRTVSRVYGALRILSLPRAPTATRRAAEERRCPMSVLEWVLIASLAFIYIWLVVTVAVVTFRKGHIVLGIFGIFLPFLWLIGAILPARRGSSYEVEQRMEPYPR